MTLHRHRDAVALPDGTTVVAVSFDPAYERDEPPDFGLYLDARWDPPWPHAHVDWPDFGLPADPDAFVAALEDLVARSRRGEVVELGCLGGHGRTGTAMAYLAVVSGVEGDPVEWVRSTYCEHAVETPEQESFARQTRRSPRSRGLERPTSSLGAGSGCASASSCASSCACACGAS